MFYRPIWDFEGYQLVSRPDTDNYYITWCKPGTRRLRRKSTGTSDPDEAKRWLIDFSRKHARPVANDPHEVSVLDCLVRYCERRMAQKEPPHAETRVLKWWAEFLDRHDILTVADLTMDVQEEFIAWRREAIIRQKGSYSTGTINRDMATMKAALRDAWKRGRLSAVPHITMLPHPRPRDRILTRDEAARLLSECREPHLHLFVLLALHTLQRPGAITSLAVGQVDLARGRIDFNHPDAAVTNKRRAVVPITPSLRPHLEEAIWESLSGFVIEWDGKPVKKVKTAFGKACRRAGLIDVTPYTLRHTGASLLAAEGVPMRQIAGMLGHTSTTTTEKHYAKHRPEFMGEAALALDRLFSEPKRLPAPETGAPNARQAPEFGAVV